MNILAKIGLMKRSEHERIAERYAEHIAILQDEADLLATKFKTAATDLAAQADEIAELKADVEIKDRVIGDLNEMIDGLRPDAQLWRNARDKRSQGRGSSNDAAPKAKKGVRS